MTYILIESFKFEVLNMNDYEWIRMKASSTFIFLWGLSPFIKILLNFFSKNALKWNTQVLTIDIVNFIILIVNFTILIVKATTSYYYNVLTCAQSSKGKRALAAGFVNVEAYKEHFIITKFNFLEVHWSKLFCRTNNGGAMIFQKSDKTWCQTFWHFFEIF